MSSAAYSDVGIEGTRLSPAAATETLMGGEPSDTDAEAISGVVADDGTTSGDTGGVRDDDDDDDDDDNDDDDDAAAICGDNTEKVAGGGGGGMDTMGLSGMSMSLSAA